ncbi:MAG: hypothetical protein R2827_00725 [Bdellovibrionales bacterium]
MHEFVLTNANSAQLELIDGETNITVQGKYRYSLNNDLQIEGILGLLNASSYAGSGIEINVTTIGGGAIYNFGEKKRGNQYFGGGGIILVSGDIDTTALYGVFGKRIALTRHLSYAPYAQVTVPSDSDSDSVISIVPFAMNALF